MTREERKERTIERARHLAIMIEAGMKQKEVADAVGLTQSQVSRIVKPLFPSQDLQSWSDGDTRRLCRLRSDGFSGAVIARRLNRSRDAVMGKIRRMGLPKTGTVPENFKAKPG